MEDNQQQSGKKRLSDRTIIHIDMDAFYASVEQREHPEFKNKPVVIGADPKGGKGRGVVSAASYEARRFGIHSAQPISQAYKRCPKAVFLPVRGRLYAEVSKKIMAIFKRYTPLIEPISLDEAFLDVTGCRRLFGDGVILARRIKEDILQEQALTASVGVAPSKLLAKIASDLDKPDGFVVVPPGKEAEFLDPLPVSRLWGVGPVMLERLKHLGIDTIGGLRRLTLKELKTMYGKMGEVLWNRSRGLDERPVCAEHQVKSISNETTFPEDIDDFEIVRDAVCRLAEKVGYRLRNQYLTARTVVLKIRFADFSTYSRSFTVEEHFQSTKTIKNKSLDLLKEFYKESRAVRLVGVGVSQLTDDEMVQTSLFQEESVKVDKVEKTVDDIRKRFGENSIISGAHLNFYKEHSTCQSSRGKEKK